jgi:uncharacterized protein (DUF58 family)
MLLVDVSASSLFGTRTATKRDISTEIAAVLSFSAVNNGDKVGMILYSDKIEKYIPPKKGKQHVLFMVRELLSEERKGKGTSLGKALKLFNNTTKQKSIAFVLSDFLDTGYADALRVASSKHDLIGIKIWDKLDLYLPKVGLIRIEDPETGMVNYLDTQSRRVRKDHQKEFFRITDYANSIFKKSGAHLLHVRTDEDYVKVLQGFFISRNK